MSQTSKERKRQLKRDNGHGAWRREPATEIQLAVLRRIATETGRTFATTITRGEASELIGERLGSNPEARAAHRRAERARRRDDQRLVNPAANWRFGDKQTAEQEAAEVRRAQRDGLEQVYMELQKWVHGHRALADREAA
ncbi:MAG: hypothetical protein ACR2OC_13270 [Solirubrobacterales bacterium]